MDGSCEHARGPRDVGGGVIALVLLALVELAVACSPSPQYKRIDLKVSGEPSAPPVVAHQPAVAPLRMAVGDMVSPKETFTTYQDLTQYLGAKLNRPVELVQRKTYAEVNDLIQSGSIDLAFVCSLPYVEGQQKFGMQLLAAPEVRGETLYRAYIIVPAGSPVAQFDQLRGMTFAFTDPDSNTGKLVPTYLLWQQHLTPEGFFQKVVYTYSHDNSMKAVADGLVDGASVDSLVYDYIVARDPALAERTRVIWRSDPFGTPPVVVPPNLAPDLKRQLSDALLGMSGDYQGRAILNNLMIDRFVVPDPSTYDPVREMLQKVNGQR
jgi:phosphonate transport system substrate-binding protein